MIEVNLHPEGSKRRRRRLAGMPSWLKSAGSGDGRDPWLIAAVATTALVLLVVGWLWMSQRGERGELDDRLVEAVEDSTRLSDLRALSDSLIARETQIRERLDLLQGLDDGRFVWPHLLVDGMAANPLAITAYVRRLQESPYVGDVRILGSQEQNLGGFSAHSFKLIVGYAEPPDSMVTAVPVAPEGT